MKTKLIILQYKAFFNQQSKSQIQPGLLTKLHVDFYATVVITPLVIIAIIYDLIKTNQFMIYALIFPFITYIFNYTLFRYSSFQIPLIVTDYLAQFPVSKFSNRLISFVCLLLSPVLLILISSFLSAFLIDVENNNPGFRNFILSLFLGYIFATLITLLLTKNHSKSKIIIQFNWKTLLKNRLLALILIALYITNYNTNTIDMHKILMYLQSNYHIYNMGMFILNLFAGLAFFFNFK